jgi:hypothetical protein
LSGAEEVEVEREGVVDEGIGETGEEDAGGGGCGEGGVQVEVEDGG